MYEQMARPYVRQSYYGNYGAVGRIPIRFEYTIMLEVNTTVKAYELTARRYNIQQASLGYW